MGGKFRGGWGVQQGGGDLPGALVPLQGQLDGLAAGRGGRPGLCGICGQRGGEGWETPALLPAPLSEGLAAFILQAARDSAIAPTKSSA